MRSAASQQEGARQEHQDNEHELPTGVTLLMLLKFYLQIKDFTKNEKDLFTATNPNTLMPSEPIRCSSSDWIVNSICLYNFLKMSKAEQKIELQNVAKPRTQERVRLKKNAKLLNSQQQKNRATRSIGGGDYIARSLRLLGEEDAIEETEERNNANTSSNNDELADEGQVNTRAAPPKNNQTFLRMLLSVGGKGKFNLVEAVNVHPKPTTMAPDPSLLPPRRIRFSSSDVQAAMGNLYDFMDATREAQKQMKNEPHFSLSIIETRRNKTILTSRATLLAAIQSTENGDAIAEDLGWNADDAEDILVEEENRSRPPKNDDTLLQMLLTIGGKGKFKLSDAVNFHPRSRGHGASLVPLKQIRFSSRDPKVAMGNLYDIMDAPRTAQKEMRNEPRFKINSGTVNYNMNALTSRAVICRAIECTANGQAIVEALHWSEVHSDDDDEETDEPPFMGLATSTPSRGAFVRGRVQNELSKRRKRVKVNDQMTSNVQIQLERNNVKARNLLETGANFLDSTFHPSQNANDPMYVCMVIIYKETRTTSHAGGRSRVKNIKITKPELTILSNNQAERKRIFAAMSEAQRSQNSHILTHIERDASCTLEERVKDINTAARAARRNPGRKRSSAQGMLEEVSTRAYNITPAAQRSRPRQNL